VSEFEKNIPIIVSANTLNLRKLSLHKLQLIMRSIRRAIKD